MTPYNTGKVQIGLLYQRPMPSNDDDMDRVQSALCPPDRKILGARIEALRTAVAEALIVIGFAAFFVAIGYSPRIWNFFA